MAANLVRLSLLAGAAFMRSRAAYARAQPPAPAAAPAAAKRVYTPADFARFAPKTAYDMLAQVPSFTIRTRRRRSAGSARRRRMC